MSTAGVSKKRKAPSSLDGEDEYKTTKRSRLDDDPEAKTQNNKAQMHLYYAAFPKDTAHKYKDKHHNFLYVFIPKGVSFISRVIQVAWQLQLYNKDRNKKLTLQYTPRYIFIVGHNPEHFIKTELGLTVSDKEPPAEKGQKKRKSILITYNKVKTINSEWENKFRPQINENGTLYATGNPEFPLCYKINVQEKSKGEHSRFFCAIFGPDRIKVSGPYIFIRGYLTDILKILDEKVFQVSSGSEAKDSNSDNNTRSYIESEISWDEKNTIVIVLGKLAKKYEDLAQQRAQRLQQLNQKPYSASASSTSSSSSSSSSSSASSATSSTSAILASAGSSDPQPQVEDSDNVTMQQARALKDPKVDKYFNPGSSDSDASTNSSSFWAHRDQTFQQQSVMTQDLSPQAKP